MIQSLKFSHLNLIEEQEGPVLKEASTRPISRTTVGQTKPGLVVDKNRTDRWKATGVIALAQANLKVLYML